MEILSSFETMFDSKGRIEARWSNSPLKRCLVEPDMVMINLVGRNNWKEFLKFCGNQSITSQLYNYSLTNRC